jgi:hypothetical protein
MSIVTIPAQTAEVVYKADVVVVGGGPAGIGASVAAARQGANVMLLEKRGFLGGNITSAYVETCNHFFIYNGFESYGIYKDIEDKYKEKFGDSHNLRKPPFRFSSEYFKIFIDEYVTNAGVKILLHSTVRDVIIEDDKIKYVIVQTKEQPVAVECGMVIDATGDGDIAYRAGVPFEMGRPQDGLCMGGTTNFRVAGVNTERILQYENDLSTVGEMYRQAVRRGETKEVENPREYPPMGRLTPGGQVTYINYADVHNINPLKIEDLTKAEIKARRITLQMYNYLKNHYEGFENSELSAIAPEMGFRDSRRIQGLYKLTKEDIEADKSFEDGIAVFPRFYDYFSQDGKQDGDGTWELGRPIPPWIFQPSYDKRCYEIPYRCLVPGKTENLLVSGRCISADNLAESSIRAIFACMQTGEAAGTAAAIAIKEGVTPKGVNIAKLRETLKSNGVVIEKNL